MDLTESAQLLGNFGEFPSAIDKSPRNRGAVPMTLIRLMMVCAAFAVVGCSQEKPASQAEPLDAIFEKWDTDNSPGCSVAAMRDGEIVHKGSYGMANLDHGIEIENATVFHVASVSKQFTAAAIVLLAQEGKLSLDDEVRDHVMELPDFGHKITIRHLIHHTSGLRDQWGLLSMTGWRYSEDLITNEDVLAVISRQRNLNFEPGSEYLYSNTGYTLLAEIVERVSGKSLREFTTEHIFHRLDMNHTFFRDDFREIVHGQAYGYVADGKNGAFRLSVTNFDTVGATSLLTTATDLMKWQNNFDSSNVGGEGFTEQMLVRGKLNNDEDIDYAFGLVHGRYRGQEVISHAGGDAGYRSFLTRFPGLGFSVAVLCNTSIDTGAMAFQITDLLIPDELNPEPAESSSEETAVTLSVEDLETKTGRFWNAKSVSAIAFVVEDAKLNVRFGGTLYELTPLSATHFRLSFGAEIEFAPDATSVVTFVGAPNETTFVRVEVFDPDGAALQKYVGTYQSDELEVLYRIGLNDDGLLTVDWLKQYGAVLQPHMRDVFTGDRGTILFQRHTDTGDVVGFEITNGRIRSLTFRKI